MEWKLDAVACLSMPAAACFAVQYFWKCLHLQAEALHSGLAGGPAALIDPALPLLLAGGAAAALASGVLGRSVVLPRLKQLPPTAVRLETMRQKLLAQVWR